MKKKLKTMYLFVSNYIQCDLWVTKTQPNLEEMYHNALSFRSKTPRAFFLPIPGFRSKYTYGLLIHRHLRTSHCFIKRPIRWCILHEMLWNIIRTKQIKNQANECDHVVSYVTSLNKHDQNRIMEKKNCIPLVTTKT